jgi:hypothetical protein
MASPFRNNKKERRRWRNAAKRSVSSATKLEELYPEVAAGARRNAEIYTKIAHSKRARKEAEQPSTNI